MHLFVDESKRRGYHFAVAGVRVEDVQAERVLVKGLLLKGQSHLHFTKESDGRRRTILRALTDSSSARCTIVTIPPGMSQIEARRICLGETVRLSAEHGATRIVFERDDAAVEADKKVLYPLLHNSQVRYDFLEKRSEPLLWIADAIVWCYTAGSPWRRLAAPLIDEVRSL